MITDIELGDFLSHSDTRLKFDNGVTVFVGHNGAGKSSIIDAITFALFGQHTRKSNKGLIRRGATQGFSKIAFSSNGIQYLAERKIDSKGTLTAQFSERVGEEWRPIAAGERKQFGESMTEEVERRIGLDFEKLKIASIVQQGELSTIIKAKPREFKELINAIIGIDKLDIASESLREVNKEFKQKIKDDIGFDDSHLDILRRDIQNHKEELEKYIPLENHTVKRKEELEKELEITNEKYNVEFPKIEKLKNLQIRKEELRSYVKEAIQEIQYEIQEKERKIRDCEGCFEYAGQKEEYEKKITKVDSAIDDSRKNLQNLSNQKSSLKEKLNLAEKLELKDNKCPVCDSMVEKLNPMFQIDHIENELAQINKQIISLENENELYLKKKSEFLEKLKKCMESESKLRAHSISNFDDLTKIRHEIDTKKTSIGKIQTSNLTNIMELSKLDSHSKTLYDSIMKIEEETKGFEMTEFTKLKESITLKQQEISKTDQELGVIRGKIQNANEKIKIINEAIKELEIVKKYSNKIDLIQTNVFNRDGPVATSLRSWALETISTKASEYLTLLNTKIQRIHLAEKTRDIVITCFSHTETLDLESLSGGEQVSVALALRLGMASLLGASNLNLMILDEPTTHLDAERRKALVNVLSQLSDVSNSRSKMQFIIITHDSEIFEDSNVERIYKFESTQNGTLVTGV